MSHQFPTGPDVLTAMKNPAVSIKIPELLGGSVIQKGVKTILYSGGYSMVFPFIKSNGSKIAVRIWLADIGEAKKRTQIIAEHLKQLNSKYFVNFKFIDAALLINGVLNPVVIMDWVEGQTLKDYIGDNIKNSAKILEIADKFKIMIEYFHANNIAHGDLQHGNIIITKNSELVVIDYDSMYVRGLENMPDNIKGLPGYQHPARISNKILTAKLDYFSELIIYLCLIIFADKPELWAKYEETNDLLFSKDDYLNPEKSEIFTYLLRSEKSSKFYNLTSRLINHLYTDSINDLNKLEELLIDSSTKLIENVASKFKAQPNPPISKKPEQIKPDLNSIISKFK